MAPVHVVLGPSSACEWSQSRVLELSVSYINNYDKKEVAMIAPILLAVLAEEQLFIEMYVFRQFIYFSLGLTPATTKRRIVNEKLLLCAYG